MRFIHLVRTEPRCRPEKPNSILHNDCGNQTHCARRIAANTTGATEKDFSRELYVAGACCHYLSAEKAAELVKTHG